MSLKRLAAQIVAGVVLVATLGAPTASAGGPTTRMVDDDGKASTSSCNATNPARKKIQKAIDASAAGDIVKVCPGDYREQLSIAGKNGLNVQGVGHRLARVIAPADMPEGDHDLLTIWGSNNVTIARLSLLAPAPATGPCEVVWDMVSIQDSLNALVMDNTIGTLGPAGLDDCGYEAGIVYGSGKSGIRGPAPGPTVSGKATLNYVYNFKFAGILIGGETTVAKATRNTVRYVHGAYTDDNTRSKVRAHATARAAQGRLTPRVAGPAGFSENLGMAIAADARGVLAFNTVASGQHAMEKGGTPVLSVGIGGVFTTRPLGAVRFADNRVHRTMVGFLVVLSEGVHVIRNTVTGNVVGILVDEATGNRVEDNGVHENLAGIILEEFTSANQVVENDATNNVEIDCLDESGDEQETRGSDIENFWDENLGDFSEPFWLCTNGENLP